jgi:hypothetical protein
MTESKNTPHFKLRDTGRTMEITRVFSVEGAPDMAAQYSGKPFQPDWLTVKLTDGDLFKAECSGQRVLMRDRLSTARARRSWFGAIELDGAPVWVKVAVATVMQQERDR